MDYGTQAFQGQPVGHENFAFHGEYGQPHLQHQKSFHLRDHVENMHTVKMMFCTWSKGHTSKMKLLRYDLKTLVQYGGLASMFAKGTVFTMDYNAAKNVLTMVILAAICAFLTYSCAGSDDDLEKLNTSSLEKLATHVNAFVPFCLALYVTLTLQRWWALRVDALGKLYDSFCNICMVISCELRGHEWFQVRDQVAKYGIASIELLVKAARGGPYGADLSTLVQKDLLTLSEVALLDQQITLWQRPMMLWAWIMRICLVALDEQGVPPPRTGVVQMQCVQARDGIATINTYLDTQLPFAYVHLITLLVNVQNLIIAVKSGVVFATAIPAGNTLLMVQQVFVVITVCLIYQGLLGISYMVLDPFGDDLLDFPIKAYTSYIAASCDAMYMAQEECPALDDERDLFPGNLAKYKMERFVQHQKNEIDDFGATTGGSGGMEEDAVPLLNSIERTLRDLHMSGISPNFGNQFAEPPFEVFPSSQRSRFAVNQQEEDVSANVSTGLFGLCATTNPKASGTAALAHSERFDSWATGPSFPSPHKVEQYSTDLSMSELEPGVDTGFQQLSSPHERGGHIDSRQQYFHYATPASQLDRRLDAGYQSQLDSGQFSLHHGNAGVLGQMYSEQHQFQQASLAATADMRHGPGYTTKGPSRHQTADSRLQTCDMAHADSRLQHVQHASGALMVDRRFETGYANQMDNRQHHFQGGAPGLQQDASQMDSRQHHLHGGVPGFQQDASQMDSRQQHLHGAAQGFQQDPYGQQRQQSPLRGNQSFQGFQQLDAHGQPFHQVDAYGQPYQLHMAPPAGNSLVAV